MEYLAYILGAIGIVAGIVVWIVKPENWNQKRWIFWLELSGILLMCFGYFLNKPLAESKVKEIASGVAKHGDSLLDCRIENLYSIVHDNSADIEKLKQVLADNEHCVADWTAQAKDALDSGVVCIASKRYREALIHFVYASRSRSGNETQLARAYFLKGVAHDLLGESEKAIEAYDVAINFRPDYVCALNCKGKSLVDLGRFEEACQFIDAALQLNPDFPEALFNKGISLIKLGEYEEAVKTCDALLMIKPHDYQALYNKGYSLAKLGRHEEAMQAYQAALKVKPDYYEALSGVGNCLDELGRYEEAIQVFDAALRIKPDYHEALCRKGTSFAALGRHEEAIQVLDAGLRIKPDCQTGLYNKGNSLAALGRYEEAIQAYDAALRIKPDFHEALNKGNSLVALGRHEEAIQAYDAALKIKPDLNPALYGKARACALIGDKPNMLTSLAAAVRLDNADRQRAKQDRAFRAFWDDPDFKKIVGEGEEGMRAEG